MIEDVLIPVDETIIGISSILPKQVLGNNIVINSKSNGFPDLDQISIAIIGVQELRNSHFNHSRYDMDKFRIEFYKLYTGNWKLNIADLGDLPNGNKVEDTYYILKEVCLHLRQMNIIPIIIGGSQDLTLSMYRSFENNNQWINITSIDNRFDFSQDEDLISGRSYMSSIILKKPSYLHNYTNLGYQSYLISQEELDLMDKLFFDSYRLGAVLDDFSLSEPIFRETDIASFDLKCLSENSSGESINSSPNGFDSRTICSLSRYAGISDRLSLAGFFELFNTNTFHKLLSQIIWYFIEGVNCRFNEYPVYTGKSFNKYIVPLSDRELIFYRSKKSDRWWVEITIENYLDNKTKSNTLLSCTYEDYEEACNDKIPERWLKASKRA